MNTAVLYGCTLQAILQSLMIGAGCYAVLLLLLRVLQGLNEQAKYLLCNAFQLMLVLSFLQPFMTLRHGSHTAVATKQIVLHPHVTEIPRETSTAVAALPQQPRALTGAALDVIDRHSALVFEIYLIGLSLALLRLLLGYAASQRLRNTGTIPADLFWNTQLQSACSRLGLRKPVILKFSTLVQSPCIVGWTKSLVLIPVVLVSRLSPEQAEAVLIHELGHFRLLHSWINLAAQVAISLLFFNPFAWLIQSLGNRHREYASDALTIRHSLQLALAESLLIIAERRSLNNPFSLTLLGPKNQLSHRIQNLLQMKPKSQNIRPIILTCGIAALVAFTGYNQLNAVPQKRAKTDTLQAISRQMQAEGKYNFLIVDALRDSFIRFGRPYEFKYESGRIYIDQKLLPEPAQSRYVAGFKSIQQSGVVSLWSVNDDSITIRQVLNPGSRFRTQQVETSNVKTRYTTSAPAPKPDVPRASGKADSKVLVHALIKDRIVDTLQPIFVKYENKVLYINGQALRGKTSEKYARLLEIDEGFVADSAGGNLMQIYPQGVMPPSSSFENSKIQFPRNSGDRPYVFINSKRSCVNFNAAFELLKKELQADSLADAGYTIHLERNTKGIFVNSKKLSGAGMEKYGQILREHFGNPTRPGQGELLDMTF